MKWLCLLLAASMLVTRSRADAPLHHDILVFIPASEGSQLFDPTLPPKGDSPARVWGSLDALTDENLYFALRMPNPLVARPLFSIGTDDLYNRFIAGVSDNHDVAGFHPYTLGSDFFIFAYDWRQELATVTAPLFLEALQKYAALHEAKSGVPAAQARFVIIGHSMGGLVARTFLSENPAWADRIAALYLVGTPNLGMVKTIQSLIVGPGGLRQKDLNFPASLLNLLPNDVSSSITKLTAITWPSLYELLPCQDPRWECVAADGSRSRVAAPDLLTTGPWEPYWPTGSLERKLFLNTWLKKQQEEGRKQINRSEWEFCQDPDYQPLQHILAQVREWRLKIGSLSYTNQLLTRPGENSRLKLVFGAGIETPTGIIAEGAHDFCTARYTYAPDNDGDGTVTGVSVLDDLHPAPDNVKLLEHVSHARLMIDDQFIDYIYAELAREKVITDGSTASFSD